MTYCDVLLAVPLRQLFTYSIPPELADRAHAGCRVRVPFGKQKTQTGIVCRIHAMPPPDTSIVVKDIIEVVDAEAVVLPSQMSFWQWIADYYLCSEGEVMKAALPAHLKRGKQPRQAAQAAGSLALEWTLPALSQAQQAALDAVRTQWRQHPVCLLHGVTSSGKTEIYMHLIAETLSQGRQVLYLLPEIVLTSQLTDRLRAVFGERLGVYHSKYSDAQRAEVWHRQVSSSPYDIIVGVRSSVLLPFQRLGLVVVDEEHEVNFKQQEPAPRYNARDAAMVLARYSGARTLLGTATPSFESFFNARRGKYGYVALTERYGDVALPAVDVVDVRELQRKRLMAGSFSPQLLTAMTDALGRHEQVILFHNRRGFSNSIMCHMCGWTPRCPHCDVTLTLHKHDGRMTCHYCGFTTDIPARCPACDNADLRGLGFGTERVEADIHIHFPDARVARMDLDTTRSRDAYEQIIHDFAAGGTDILVGTQMVTKGLDFERVSVVGIISADTMLNQPDFRAYERAYQMLSQVAGRAGRRRVRGRVILQTVNAQLPLLQHVIASDFDAVYRQEMAERRQFVYPPFVKMVVFYVRHHALRTVELAAREATLLLRAHFGTRVLGPDEPPVARVSGMHIRRILIKVETTLPLADVRRLLVQAREQLLLTSGCGSVQAYFDVDPLT